MLRRLVLVSLVLVSACGGAAAGAPASNGSSSPTSRAAPLFPAPHGTFMRISIDAIARTPLADDILPAIDRLFTRDRFVMRARELALVVISRGEDLRMAMVFADAHAPARAFLDAQAASAGSRLEWIEQPTPHVTFEHRDVPSVIALIAPRIAVVAPASDLPHLQARSPEAALDDVDLRRSPNELLRFESSAGFRSDNPLLRDVTAYAIDAFDTGNSVRLDIEMTLGSERSADAQVSLLTDAIALAEAQSAQLGPFGAVLHGATITRDGTHTRLAAALSYADARALYASVTAP